MALKSKSLFLYGLKVTSANNAIDFRLASGGTILRATLRTGYYSLTSLSNEVVSAMKAVAPSHSFQCTADRSINGGLENRVTIRTTSSGWFELLFASGPRASSSCAGLIGFPAQDKTGATQYTGTTSAGTVLVPAWWGKGWQPPELFKKNFGAVSVTASGEKEAVVFAIQQFMNVQFDYELEADALTKWPALIDWMISQRPFDFTPEISSPNIVHDVTLEKSSDDGKGLGFQMREMLPDFPGHFTTGPMTFRKRGV